MCAASESKVTMKAKSCVKVLGVVLAVSAVMLLPGVQHAQAAPTYGGITKDQQLYKDPSYWRHRQSLRQGGGARS